MVYFTAKPSRLGDPFQTNPFPLLPVGKHAERASISVDPLHSRTIQLTELRANQFHLAPPAASLSHLALK